MKPFHSLTVAEQLAAHLRAEMQAGRLSGIMPGVLKLEKETGANRKTVDTALRILEREGLLAPQGIGKRRRIVSRPSHSGKPGLRIGIFFFESQDAGAGYVLSLESALAARGHLVLRAPDNFSRLGMDVAKVARIVGEADTDAWVVFAASKEILEWFHGNGIPVMAMFGRRRGLPVAGIGPDKIPAYREVTRTLIGLGHRRIVWLTRRIRRVPEPGVAEQAFLDELTVHGISPGPYHLPDWEETREGFHDLMESLFRLTAPTAIIADEAQFYFAARHFLSARGLAIPGDISMVCTDGTPHFEWCTPSVAHIRWDHAPLVKRIVKWAHNLSRGKPDVRQTFIKAEFVAGGTIARARRM